MMHLASAKAWWTRFHSRYAILADSSAQFMSDVTNGLFGFLFWVVAARLYPSTTVGIASSLISAVYFIGNLSRLGLDYALLLTLPKEPSRERRLGMIVTSLTIIGAVSIGITALFIVQTLFAIDATHFLREYWTGALIFVLCGVGWSVGLVYDQILLCCNYSQFIPIKNGAFSFVKLLFLVIALSLVGEQFGILTAFAVGIVGGLLSTWPLITQIADFHLSLVGDSLTTLRTLLPTLAFGNYVSATIAGLPNWLLPIIIADRVGADHAAYFYSSWMLVTIINAGPAAVGRSLLAENARKGLVSRSVIKKIYTYMLLLVIPVSILIFGLAPYILHFFGADYSQQATSLLRYLALACIPFSVWQINLMILRAQNKLKQLTVYTGFHSLITLVGAYVLLPVYDIEVVGIIWLVACSLGTLICLLLFDWHVHSD